ncbi:MAG: hypothetical protein DWQ06_16735 [Calditrichaeota bacterium]|nr:MAG: hypothetical protein DWQ06_16735 [Calditrichota bacterium]
MNAKVKKSSSSFSLGILLLIVGTGWLFFELDLLEEITLKFIFVPILLSIYLLATAFSGKSAIRAFWGSAALFFAIFQIFTKWNIELEALQGEVLILIFGLALAFSSILKKKKSSLLILAIGVIIFGVFNVLEGTGTISTSTLIFLQKLWPLVLVAMGIKILLSKPKIIYNSFSDSSSDSINFEFGSSGSRKSKSKVKMDFDFTSGKKKEEAEAIIEDIPEEEKLELKENTEEKKSFEKEMNEEVESFKDELKEELKTVVKEVKEEIESATKEVKSEIESVVKELETELSEKPPVKPKEPSKPKKLKKEKDENLDDESDKS